MLLTIIDLPQL